jgi:hypothetical protein
MVAARCEAKRNPLIEALTKLTPMQRAGTSEEVAKLVLFLASDDSSFITGSEVVIDGGFVSCAATKELRKLVEQRHELPAHVKLAGLAAYENRDRSARGPAHQLAGLGGRQRHDASIAIIELLIEVCGAMQILQRR